MGLPVSSVEDSNSWFLHFLIRLTAGFSQSQWVDAVVPGPHDEKMKREVAELEKESRTILSQREGREMEDSPGNTNTQYIQVNPFSYSNPWQYGKFHQPN